MEDLNKQQLILLCIFVSFIVSLATSIVVVSLTDAGAAVVTQNISQIVERTIERVVEVPNISSTTPPVKVPDDRLGAVVKKVAPAIGTLGESSQVAFVLKYAQNFWLVSVDSSLASTTREATVGGTRLLLEPVPVTEAHLALFRVSTTTEALGLVPALTSSAREVVGLTWGSRGVEAVATGTLSNDVMADGTIETEAAIDKTTGAPIVSFEGNVLGLSLGSLKMLPTRTILKVIDSLK